MGAIPPAETVAGGLGSQNPGPLEMLLVPRRRGIYLHVPS